MRIPGLGNVGMQGGGLFGRPTEGATGSESGDRDTFTEGRFTSFTGDNLQDGAWVRIAEFTVPAQTGYVWGYGEPAPGKAENQGRLYADINGNDGTGVAQDVVGRLRFSSENAVGKNRDDHGTFHTSELEGDIGDKRTWLKFPERDMPIVTEDSKLVLEFEYDAAASVGTAIDVGLSTIRANVTEFS